MARKSMEIYAYWQIIRRRWWIPLLLTILVTILSALQLRPWQVPPPTYSASMRFLIGVLPVTDPDLTLYDARFSAWQTSEYLVDDFTEVVSSLLFAEQVSQRLATEGINVPAGAIQGSAETGRQHRILTVIIDWPTDDKLTAITRAIVDELLENHTFYFAQLGTENTTLTVLDQPTIEEVRQSSRSNTEWSLRTLLALIVGVSLIFFLDYLDTSVRNSRDLEEMGMDVVGMIPKH